MCNTRQHSGKHEQLAIVFDHMYVLNANKRWVMNQSNLLQLLRINEGPSKSNTIYSVKISYRGPKVGICSIPFNLGAAIKEIRYEQVILRL